MSLERSDVTPLPKQTRPWVCPKDDADCTRAKPCRSCLGRRSRNKGKRKQRIAQRGLGIPMTLFHGANGEESNWRGPFRAEVKSQAQANPVATRYLAAERQSEATRPIGDHRPFVAVYMPDGWGSEGLVVVRISKLNALVEAAYNFQTSQP